MPTTTARAMSGRLPLATSRPTARISAAISRPCWAIQVLCQASMTTARPSTAALNTSCPPPSNKAEMREAKTATTQAPSAPPATPRPTIGPRPGTPRVAAMTMPTTRPASRTSRRTMRRAASISLLRDDGALGRLLVVLAHELVAAGLQRPDPHRGAAARRHDLLDLERTAVEFLGSTILVVHGDLERLVGWHLHLGGREAVVLERELDRRRLGRLGRRRQEQRRPGHRRDRRPATHEHPVGSSLVRCRDGYRLAR